MILIYNQTFIHLHFNRPNHFSRFITHHLFSLDWQFDPNTLCQQTIPILTHSRS
jgi:hypothetical protein